jgi:hypothetical protein
MPHPYRRLAVKQGMMGLEQHKDAARCFFISLDAFVRQGDKATFDNLSREIAVLYAAIYSATGGSRLRVNNALAKLLGAMEGVEARVLDGGHYQFDPSELREIRSVTEMIDSELRRVPFHIYSDARSELDAIVRRTLCQSQTASPFIVLR